MRKKVLITETKTVGHEILVDCKDDEAAANLDVKLDEWTKYCSYFYEVIRIIEDVEGVKNVFMIEDPQQSSFEYEEMEECRN